MTLLRLACVGCVRSSSGTWAWHSRGLVSKWYLPKSVSLCLPFTPTAKRETSKNTLETLIPKMSKSSVTQFGPRRFTSSGQTKTGIVTATGTAKELFDKNCKASVQRRPWPVHPTPAVFDGPMPRNGFCCCGNVHSKGIDPASLSDKDYVEWCWKQQQTIYCKPKVT